MVPEYRKLEGLKDCRLTILDFRLASTTQVLQGLTLVCKPISRRGRKN